MSKLFEQLVQIRGLDGGFLRPKYEELINPYCLPDMGKVVARVKTAVEKREKCIIYGDYDVDGVTASVVLHDALKMAGLDNIKIMLPNRFTDGYGMSTKIVQAVTDNRVNLVFTVDCGSRNHEIIDELMEKGVDVVITDHHECGETLPTALAIVNPKRDDEAAWGYLQQEEGEKAGKIKAELRELAGVGVVFKLAQALVQAGLIRDGQEKWLLDLVTLGTICDSMRLVGENRRLCKYGTLVIEKTRRVGLKELMMNSGVKKISGDSVGYQIGPRLNAAGRMDTAEKALDLLMAQKRTDAARLASQLEILNEKRRQQQKSALDEIRKRGLDDSSVIVEQGEWHEGVLGIIAGRLTEEYKRPAFVLSECGGVLKGSGRSFGDFNLAEALMACKDAIIGGGGHAAACGVKVASDGLSKFKTAVNEYYKSLDLKNQEKFLDVQADIVVEDFEDLSLELIEELRVLEPFGEGNQMPIFRLSEVRIMEAARLGEDGRHLRLVLWDRFGHSFKIIGFGVPEEYLKLRVGDTVDAWIVLEENEFRGIRNVEGRIVKLGW